MDLPILILPFALAVCLLAPVVYRKTGLIGGCLATLLAGSCLGYDFFHVSIVTLDRALLGGLCVLYFLQRNFHGLKPHRTTMSDLVLLGFIVSLLGITFAHDWKWDGARPVAVLLFFYLLPFAMYWLSSRCELTENSFRMILGFFVGFGIYLTLTGVCEVLGIYGAVFPRYIANSDTVEFLGRARGPFLNPIGNGMYLTASLICCCLSWNYVHKVHRPALIALAGLFCVGAICTLTRSVWLGVGVALIGMATLAVPSRYRIRLLVAAAVFGAAGLAVAGKSLVAFKRDKNLTAAETAESAKLRPILAAFAYEMFQDHPVTGVGLSQYKRYNIDYLTERSADLPLEKAKGYVQHNVFLSLLVETGLVGLVLFCLVLVIWAVNAWQLWHATHLPLWQRQAGLFCLALLGAYLPNGMFHEMSVIPMQNMLLFFVGGLNRNLFENCLKKPETVTHARRADERRALPGLPAS